MSFYGCNYFLIYMVGSFSLKKPYFSSKREGALVFISDWSPCCKDHISEETHANFNLATLFFYPEKMVILKRFIQLFNWPNTSLNRTMRFMVSFIQVLTSKNSGFMQSNSANNRHPLWACSIYVQSRNGRDLLQNLCKTYLQSLYSSERALMYILLKSMIILNAIKLNLWKKLITERISNKIPR